LCQQEKGHATHERDGTHVQTSSFALLVINCTKVQVLQKKVKQEDNAVAESFFSCMKGEELSHNYYDMIEALEQAVSEYIDSRPDSSS